MPRFTSITPRARHAAAIIALAGAALGQAAFAQQPATAGSLPAAQTQGALRYACGGIGIDESTAMRAAMKDHPLSLLFAAAGGRRARPLAVPPGRAGHAAPRRPRRRPAADLHRQRPDLFADRAGGHLCGGSQRQWAAKAPIGDGGSGGEDAGLQVLNVFRQACNGFLAITSNRCQYFGPCMLGLMPSVS